MFETSGRSATARSGGAGAAVQRGQRRWAPLVVATLLVAIAMATSVGVAQAASGGGCGGTTATRWGSWKACISSPGGGYGLPDTYVTLAKGHPPCSITIVAYDSAGNVASTQSYVCPATAHNVRFIGQGFPGWGTYYTVVYIAGVSSAPSPNIKLP